MATKVNILSFEISNHGWLQGAPNVEEGAEIRAALNKAGWVKKGLDEGPLNIAASYRGHDFYLENGAILCRSEPKTDGGNGLLAVPNGTENCMVYYNDLWFKARVEFL
jgi:hypothetical protein